MKDFLIYLLTGFLAGVPGGMGMGGGTILIPILTIFLDVKQKIAQSANLVSFIPMAIIAVIIHYKNGLIKKQGLLTLILSAVVFAVSGGLLAKFVDGKVLQKIFGGFLILTSIFAFFADGIDRFKKKS